MCDFFEENNQVVENFRKQGDTNNSINLCKGLFGIKSLN